MEIEIRDIILNFPKQLKEGILAAKNVKINGEFDNIAVCGMGGSAWPAEILRDWIFPSFPFYVNKTYNLPPQTNKKSLVIICSYSGNTEETLSCYSEAKKRGF
jgi:glucose/mannose-6-phosphate isomerase